jgi:hypothetical protein
MEKNRLSNLSDDTKIAGKYTVDDWIKLRDQLIKAPTPEKWKDARAFFELRIETRFLEPIKAILSINKNEGEGHAAVALQCALIEFLEALYQGKLYREPKTKDELDKNANRLGITLKQLKNHKHPTEYTASCHLFSSFLTKQEPFKPVFTQDDRADIFYRHFRCGLLHEAATKGESLIRSKKSGDLNCIVEQNGDGLVIYRDAFQKALLDYIKNYGNELLQSEKLQKNFIRKMDEIAGIQRCFYFAYGKNLSTEVIKLRIGREHEKYKAELKGYAFIYNKKSQDGSSKANIEKSAGESTWGVCYEIDLRQFDILKNKYEKGYDDIEVWVKIGKGKSIIAKSFTAKKEFISDLPPSREYAKCIYSGAEENQLPEDYISKYIALAS